MSPLNDNREELSYTKITSSFIGLWFELRSDGMSTNSSRRAENKASSQGEPVSKKGGSASFRASGEPFSASDLAQRLREIRENCGYTQQQLANVLNIDRSTYSYYETGKTSPDISTLVTLANMFSVRLEDLLGQESSLYVNDSSTEDLSSPKKAFANSHHIYELQRDERQLIAFYRAMSKEKREEFLAEAKKKVQDSERQL